MNGNATSKTGTKKTILVVEDDRFYSNICKTKLTKEGYTVVIVSNGAWAVKYLEKQKPGLVLLDLIMPEFDGFEFLKTVRSNPQLADLPIIALTNLSQPEDKQKASVYGITDYIVKTSISIQDLITRIRKVLPA